MYQITPQSARTQRKEREQWWNVLEIGSKYLLHVRALDSRGGAAAFTITTENRAATLPPLVDARQPTSVGKQYYTKWVEDNSFLNQETCWRFVKRITGINNFYYYFFLIKIHPFRTEDTLHARTVTNTHTHRNA